MARAKINGIAYPAQDLELVTYAIGGSIHIAGKTSHSVTSSFGRLNKGDEVSFEILTNDGRVSRKGRASVFTVESRKDGTPQFHIALQELF